MGNEMGSLRTAAKRIKMPFMKYFMRRAKGEHRCWFCRRWKPVAEFYQDRNRAGGLRADCKKCSRKQREAREKRDRRAR
jgi:hypothetical protein